ncbi:MAG: hypothetical protein SFY92_12710 [Verrucomicrobiae bacterium]|nr:hypothetical protein [Verrucomicrobiae bacterium]
MIPVVEFRRLLNEWRIRWERIKVIVQPPAWSDEEWRQFSLVLVALVERNGASWTDAQGTSYWDLRWTLQEGGTLIVQVQLVPDQEVQLVVAQEGGFVNGTTDSYTWLWSTFNQEGRLTRDPYFVDGTWKEALMQLLVPYQYQAGFYLSGTTATPQQLMLENNATPGYHDNLQQDPQNKPLFLTHQSPH